MSLNRSRHALETGGPKSLVSKSAAGARPSLTADQQQELMALIEAGPAVHGHLDQRLGWPLALPGESAESAAPDGPFPQRRR
jgi:hypothetical protein